MKKIKLNKDQLQKVILSVLGFIGLLYVYFTFFLGPLNASRDAADASIADLQAKMASSKAEMAKVSTLERQADAATSRFAALKALSAEGAPIAWFPPRVKTFFANQKIDKAGVRLEASAPFTQPELAAWVNNTWSIELPEADFATLGNAIAELESREPLLAIAKLRIHASPAEPQFQQVTLTVASTLVNQ